jgi:hypothetical protein
MDAQQVSLQVVSQGPLLGEAGEKTKGTFFSRQ